MDWEWTVEPVAITLIRTGKVSVNHPDFVATYLTAMDALVTPLASSPPQIPNQYHSKEARP